MKPDLVIVGLGNPGKEYEKTRHNAGWIALDVLAKEVGADSFSDAQKFLCTLSEGTLTGKKVLLVKPTTFMNRSGECIRKLVDFYKLNPATQILAVCDDIDLPLGTFRFRASGGPGTHNGLKSIVETLGEGFPRHRIGLGTCPAQMDLAAWVLSRLSSEELQAMRPAMNSLKESAMNLLKVM